MSTGEIEHTFLVYGDETYETTTLPVKKKETFSFARLQISISMNRKKR